MTVEDIHTVVVVGAGLLGTQIALQCALHGYSVYLYDISEDALQKGRALLNTYPPLVTSQAYFGSEQVQAAIRSIHLTTNAAEAAASADLLSESVPEDPALKSKVFSQFNTLCPQHTIFTTDTSSLRPSMFAASTGRPSRFAALHFHSYVWQSNVVDVMPHPGTDPKILDLLESFSSRIGQIPIRLEKEHTGYVFNSMLHALNRTALTLAATKVTNFRNVDRAWMGVMKTRIGPFGIIDAVGIDTSYQINQYWATALKDPQLQLLADFLKVYVDKGTLGVKTGQGFYTYPDPDFRKPDFITGKH